MALYQTLHVWMAHARNALKNNKSFFKTCLKTKTKKNLDAIRTMYGLAQVVNHVLADGAHMDRAAI